MSFCLKFSYAANTILDLALPVVDLLHDVRQAAERLAINLVINVSRRGLIETIAMCVTTHFAKTAGKRKYPTSNSALALDQYPMKGLTIVPR